MQPNINPPLDLPSIIIDGRKLTLKSSLLAPYLLAKWGIDAAKAWAQPGGMSRITFELFAAYVGHNYVETGEPVPTPEQWALRLDQEHLAEIGGKLKLLFPNQPTPAALGVEAKEAGTEQTPVH